MGNLFAAGHRKSVARSEQGADGHAVGKGRHRLSLILRRNPAHCLQHTGLYIKKPLSVRSLEVGASLTEQRQQLPVPASRLAPGQVLPTAQVDLRSSGSTCKGRPLAS